MNAVRENGFDGSTTKLAVVTTTAPFVTAGFLDREYPARIDRMEGIISAEDTKGIGPDRPDADELVESNWRGHSGGWPLPYGGGTSD